MRHSKGSLLNARLSAWSPRQELPSTCAALVALFILALPARSQGTLPANCVSYTQYLASPNSGTSDLYNNFASPPNPSTNSTFDSVAIAFPTSGGAVAGDLNSTYATMFYSIDNLNAWMATNNYCPLELIVVADLPDARYFSVTVNDMHYMATQHVSDADMDPGEGLVFKLSPSGAYAALYTFSGGADGGLATSPVTLDKTGYVYGTTSIGGDQVCGCGVVFELSASGQETVLHTFTNGADGVGGGTLAMDGAGNLYGNAWGGTLAPGGLLYKIMPPAKRAESASSGF
jgi:uncharacterized repeat protein (TIGR03803 family)